MGIPKPPTRTNQRANPPLPASAAPKKTFSIAAWTGKGEGTKIGIYAESGMGKTTLCTMLPKPVFIGLDDGGRLTRNPKTGEPIQAVQGISTFQDVRDALQALQNVESFPDVETVVIDTVTVLQDLAVPHILETIPSEKGAKMPNIVKYGYNKGYQHLYDTMKLILQDCDGLIRLGKNVVFIAQAGPHKVSNPSGDDFLRSGPRLYSGTPSVESLYCEWLDYILLIDYNTKAVEGHKVVSDNVRVVHTVGQVHFRAKHRTDRDIPAVVSFETPDDDSIWAFVFDLVQC